MPDRNHLSDDDWIKVPHPMQYCTILHITFRANANRIDISPNHSIHPYARLFTKNDVADDLCGWIGIAARWNDWSYSLIRTNHETNFTLPSNASRHAMDFITLPSQITDDFM